MKRLAGLIFCIFLFSLSYAQDYAQDKKKETITIKTKIHCDHCIQCGSCGGRINDAIREIGGIKKVNINPKENTITVKYNTAKTSPEKIRKAIAEAGYDADDVKASSEGHAKLDGCCKVE